MNRKLILEEYVLKLYDKNLNLREKAKVNEDIR